MTPLPIIEETGKYYPDLTGVKEGDYLYSPANSPPAAFEQPVSLFTRILANNMARDISLNMLTKSVGISEVSLTTNVYCTASRYEFYLCSEEEYMVLLFQHGLAGK